MSSEVQNDFGLRTQRPNGDGESSRPLVTLNSALKTPGKNLPLKEQKGRWNRRQSPRQEIHTVNKQADTVDLEQYRALGALTSEPRNFTVSAPYSCPTCAESTNSRPCDTEVFSTGKICIQVDLLSSGPTVRLSCNLKLVKKKILSPIKQQRVKIYVFLSREKISSQRLSCKATGSTRCGSIFVDSWQYRTEGHKESQVIYPVILLLGM